MVGINHQKHKWVTSLKLSHGQPIVSRKFVIMKL